MEHCGSSEIQGQGWGEYRLDLLCTLQEMLQFICREIGRKFGLRIKEHEKEVNSFTAGTQTRASRARESSVTHKSATMLWKRTMSSTGTRQKWSTERHSNRPDGYRIEEAPWIRKTPMCMNLGAGSYQLSHTWDQMTSRSRARSSFKQSTRRDEMSDGHRNVVTC